MSTGRPDEQAQGGPERLRITFKAATPREEHAFAQSGAIAMEQAIDILEGEGIKASVEAPSALASADGARAIGADDILVSILGNALFALLYQLVSNLAVRIRGERARAPQRAQHDERIVIQANGREVSFSVNIDPHELSRQLSLWVQEANLAGDIQVRLE